MIRTLIVMSVTGCAFQRSEAESFALALALADQAKPEAVEACTTLSSESARGECISLYVSKSSDRNICDTLDGFWRDECNFMWAEAEFKRLDNKSSDELCKPSGSLSDDCRRHFRKQFQLRQPGTALPWVERLRHHQPLSVSPCAGDEGCENVVEELLLGRWERELSDPHVLGVLCSRGTASGRFAWVPSSRLDNAMDDLRRRRCTSIQ
jgi:hypothetical protein